MNVQLLTEVGSMSRSSQSTAARSLEHDHAAGIGGTTGVLRSSHDGASLANTRRATRTRLARLDLRPYARRWMDGAETEQLAAELAVPADLLWDALAGVLAVMTPDYRTDCHADRCLFACAAICAASAEIGTTKAGRLY
ncbi:hypothetical protein ACFPCV_30985 [Actinophytocola glycyrrhizae]|uniref:Uncharacterized protein n=2 Tax=Actinophytocola glycyrrhizae TaxID=2044873 RepID=A0ABV9S882_9PSEU